MRLLIVLLLICSICSFKIYYDLKESDGVIVCIECSDNNFKIYCNKTDCYINRLEKSKCKDSYDHPYSYDVNPSSSFWSIFTDNKWYFIALGIAMVISTSCLITIKCCCRKRKKYEEIK